MNKQKLGANCKFHEKVTAQPTNTKGQFTRETFKELLNKGYLRYAIILVHYCQHDATLELMY